MNVNQHDTDIDNCADTYSALRDGDTDPNNTVPGVSLFDNLLLH